MNWKQVTVLRAIWNIFVSLSSAAWVLMLFIFVYCLLEEPGRIQEDLLFKFGPPYPVSSIKIIRISLITAGALLAILIAFLVFVSANRLWSVKEKPEDE